MVTIDRKQGINQLTVLHIDYRNQMHVTVPDFHHQAVILVELSPVHDGYYTKREQQCEYLYECSSLNHGSLYNCLFTLQSNQVRNGNMKWKLPYAHINLCQAEKKPK